MKPVVVELVQEEGAEPKYGTMIDVQTLVIPCAVSDETPLGVKVIPQVLVLWEDNRSPAPSFHNPNEISWLEIPGVTDDDDEEAEEGDDEEEEEEETEPQGEQAGP